MNRNYAIKVNFDIIINIINNFSCYFFLCKFIVNVGNHVYAFVFLEGKTYLSDVAECPNQKKCRARYGVDQQNQWCKPCR